MSNKVNEVVWGADPEFGAVYRSGDDFYVMPPIKFRRDFGVTFEPDPEGRHPVFMQLEGSIVHEDGAAFEMSLPPTSSWKELWERIQYVKKVFAERVLSGIPGVLPELLSIPSIKWDVERWKGEGDDFELCTQFGCDPDFDVYDTKTCQVADASLHPWRYFGGHIHMSNLDIFEEDPALVVRCMVITAGLASTAFSPYPELEKERMFLYGKPGKFRPQNYKDGTIGLEYRTPSTAWTSSFTMAEKVFNWAKTGLEIAVTGLYKEILPEFELSARKAIKDVQTHTATEILSKIGGRL